MISSGADRLSPAGSGPARPGGASGVDRHNNFGLLRLSLSLLVLVSHSFLVVNGANESDVLYILTGGQMTLGAVAVYSFFMISGYLITQSWQRSRSAEEFILRRVRRLYPGYLVALVFSVAVGVSASGRRATELLEAPWSNSDRVVKAVAVLDAHLLLQTPAFPDNPLPYILNGSVWTLQPELLCYSLVLLLGLCGRRFGRAGVLALLVGAYSVIVVNEIAYGGEGQAWWRLITHFVLGAAVACYGSPRFTLARAVTSLAVLSGAACVRHAFLLAFPIAGGYLVFSAAYAGFRPWAAPLARVDLSYGVYLYAFPIQQLLVMVTGVRSPWILYAITIPPTVVAAWVSWRFVESPALAKRGTK